MKIVLTPGRSFLLPLAVLQLLPTHLTTTTAAAPPASTFTPSLSGLDVTAIFQQRVSAAATAAAAAVPMTKSGIIPNGGGGGGRALLFGNNKMEFFPIQQATRARALQTTGAGGNVCAPIEAFEDDDDVLQKFESSFQPTCTCKEDDLVDISGYTTTNPVPENGSLQDLQVWVDGFNAYGSNLEGGNQVGCINSCSVCISAESPCLILEERQGTILRGAWNISLEEFAAFVDLSDEAAGAFFLEQITIFYQETTTATCYMDADSSSGGKVCFAVIGGFSSEVGFSLAELGVDDLMYECSISVDGVDCTSCSVDVTTGCTRADCTNIPGDSSASISLFCGGEDRTSYPGVFGPIYDLFVLDNVAYTLGSCDGSSPTPPAVTSPVAAPVASSPVVVPTAAASPVALSPVVVPTAALSPVALSPVALSPVALSPVALSPVASSPVALPSVGASNPPPVPPIFGNSGGVAAYGVGEPILVLASAFAALVMVL